MHNAHVHRNNPKFDAFGRLLDVKNTIDTKGCFVNSFPENKDEEYLRILSYFSSQFAYIYAPPPVEITVRKPVLGWVNVTHA
jgi:hypothetical protein